MFRRYSESPTKIFEEILALNIFSICRCSKNVIKNSEKVLCTGALFSHWSILIDQWEKGFRRYSATLIERSFWLVSENYIYSGKYSETTAEWGSWLVTEKIIWKHSEISINLIGTHFFKKSSLKNCYKIFWEITRLTI